MCVIQIAWALNKGVKQEYKQFWDVDLGVTYIPWEKLKLDDLEDFAEGGIIDQETVNDGEKKPFNTLTHSKNKARLRRSACAVISRTSR